MDDTSHITTIGANVDSMLHRMTLARTLACTFRRISDPTIYIYIYVGFRDIDMYMDQTIYMYSIYKYGSNNLYMLGYPQQQQ